MVQVNSLAELRKEFQNTVGVCYLVSVFILVLLSISAIVLKKEYLTHKHEAQQLTVHRTNNRKLWKGHSVELQRHHLRQEILSIFQSLEVRRSDAIAFLKTPLIQQCLKVCLQSLLMNFRYIGNNTNWSTVFLTKLRTFLVSRHRVFVALEQYFFQ